MLSWVIWLVAFPYTSIAEKITDMSFEPPFNDVDLAGDRMVSRMWRSFGATSISQTFVRLTPDRQSKRGALWSRKPLNVKSASVLLKFRISGQGKTFFGDGLALWIVTQGYYLEGDLHAFTDKFTGIGIIFDTYKNSDNLAAHRDVTVLVNPGERSYEDMVEKIEGCNINVRYHAERADFNVKDSVSQAKILVSENTFELLVDPRNTGKFQPCVKLTDLQLPPGWLEHAHIGLTASTGQLADNHDVISLLSYSEAAVMEQEQADRANKKFFPIVEGLTVEAKISRIEEAVERILSRLDFLDAHEEHEFVTVEDKLDNLQAKLDDLSPDEEHLNHVVHRKTEDLTESVTDLTKRLEKVDVSLTNLIKSGGGGAWKLPFVLLALLVVGAVVGTYMFYLHLQRKWKLP